MQTILRACMLTTLFCSSCGGREGLVLCETPCGMELYGLPTRNMPDGWTCESFNTAEELALAKFRMYVSDNNIRGMGTEDMCRRLSGTRVHVNAHSWWTVQRPTGPLDVAGVADCFDKSIEIGNSPLAKTSLAHEMAHTLQSCVAPPPPFDKGRDADHSNWDSAGIQTAINEWASDLAKR